MTGQHRVPRTCDVDRPARQLYNPDDGLRRKVTGRPSDPVKNPYCSRYMSEVAINPVADISRLPGPLPRAYRPYSHRAIDQTSFSP